MTPIHKTPTREVYDTTATRLYQKAAVPRPVSKLRLDMPDPSDVARMRPLEPLPLPVYTVPVRAYSAAFRAVGGEVVRIQQPYK